MCGAMEHLSAEKREAILDGAARVFAERGYEGASMSAITAAAGVSKGTIYQHFEGKAALFGAAVARECDRSVGEAFRTAGPDAGLRQTLTDIGERFLAMLTSPAALAVERIVTSEAARFPELARAFWEAGPARGIALMAGFLAAQAEAGALVVPDPAFAAEQFFMLCQTRVVMRTRLGLTHDAGDVGRVVAEAVEVFLRAYCPREVRQG